MARKRSQRRTRTQHKSRKVRGGSWYNPLSWFKEEEPSYFSTTVEEKPLLQSVGEGAQDLMQKADQKILEASNAISSGVSSATQNVQEVLNSDIPLGTSSVPDYSQPTAPVTAFGGRRRRRTQQKAGKGGLGLAYYATPVDGMKVAEPTYWEEYKGGARRSRSRRRTQRKSRGRGRGRGRGRSQRRARA
jgi:hypothetical protein